MASVDRRAHCLLEQPARCCHVERSSRAEPALGVRGSELTHPNHRLVPPCLASLASAALGRGLEVAGRCVICTQLVQKAATGA